MGDRTRVGNVDIYALLDVGPNVRDPSQMFPGVPAEMWAQYKEHLTPEGKYPTNNSAFCVRTPQHNILVDTGLGKGPHANAGGAMGKLLSALQALGLTADDIDLVLITHLHGDHVGWNVDWSGSRPRATFRRARYIIPRVDWDYFTKSPEPTPERKEAVEKQVTPLTKLDCLEMVEGEQQITPEITTVPTPGHTPGHQCFYIQSGGQRAMLTGDLFHNPAQADHPEWSVNADVDKVLSAKTRKAMMDVFVRDRFNAVCAPHVVVGRNIGQVIELKGRRYWQVV